MIKCLPWQAVLERYDTKETLFYLDPPYYGTEDYYQTAFGRDEFTEMAGRLRGVQGRFILSLNDCPEVRQLFDGFDMEEVKVGYSLLLKVSARHQRGELIISN